MVQKNPPSQDTSGYDYSRLSGYRDRHQGGIGWEMGKMTHDRQARLRLRAKPDIRLFKMLIKDDPRRHDAFEKIFAAHQIMNAGLGVKVQNFEGGGRGTGDIEHGAGLLAHYRLWKELCKKRHISPLMAEDIIIAGMMLIESDTARKMRKGTAKTNLIKCLDAWFEVR